MIGVKGAESFKRMFFVFRLDSESEVRKADSLLTDGICNGLFVVILYTFAFEFIAII